MSETSIEHEGRISALEAKVEILTRSVDDATAEIRKLVSIVEQARGARYALVGLGAVAGAVVSWAIGAAGKIGAVVGVLTK